MGAGCDDSRRGGSFPRSLLASEGVRGAGAPGVPLRVRVRTERFPDGHRICTWALVCYTCGASGRAGEAAWTCVFGRVLAGSWPPVRSAALPFDPWRVRSWRVLVHLSGVAAPRRTSIGLGAPFEWSLDAPPDDGVRCRRSGVRQASTRRRLRAWLRDRGCVRALMYLRRGAPPASFLWRGVAWSWCSDCGARRRRAAQMRNAGRGTGGILGRCLRWRWSWVRCRASSRATWLILPVVICLSQRLSHACLSISDLYCETANGSLNQLWFI